MKLFKLQIMMAAMIVLLSTGYAIAQVPAPGKYNTINYPEDRKAIEALNTQQDNSQYLNDDYIAVGPEGKVSYGFEELKKRIYR